MAWVGGVLEAQPIPVGSVTKGRNSKVLGQTNSEMKCSAVEEGRREELIGLIDEEEEEHFVTGMG